MKKSTLKKVVPFGILFFGISLLLWNCEKEEIEFNQPNNLNFAISNQFDSDNFKAYDDHSFHSKVFSKCTKSDLINAMEGAKESFFVLIVKYKAPRKKWVTLSVM